MTDDELIAAFEDRSLPFDRWNHRTHVRVAYIYATRYEFGEAERRIAAGIRAYNAANQVPETETSGYNETTTVAFLRLICSTLASYGNLFPTNDSESFCEIHPHLLQKTLLRLFYSPERRGLPEAKHCFVEPDLCTLPDPARFSGKVT